MQLTKLIIIAVGSLSLVSPIAAQVISTPSFMDRVRDMITGVSSFEAQDVVCFENCGYDYVPEKLVGAEAGVYVEDGDDYRPEENLKIIHIPKEIKDQLEPPSWLKNWEEAEFVSAGYDTEDMLGMNEKNLTLKAAYHMLSVSGGVWLNSSFENQRSSELDQAVLEWYRIDDESLAKQIHHQLGL